MHSIVFSTQKKIFAEFAAEALNTERTGQGLLIAAQGEMVMQDTVILEQFISEPQRCHVRISEGDAEVVSEQFSVTFFEVEPDKLTVQLGS